MTRDQETHFLRLMQVADKETFDKHFTLVEEETLDGEVQRRYDVQYQDDSGYFILAYRADSRELTAAEMDVCFQASIGLNRSPLELRIFAEHVLALDEESAAQ